MKRIIYTNKDGSISIVVPSGEISIEDVLKKDVPEDCKESAKIIDELEIPTDRTFRKAWVHDGKTLKVYLEKAKELHKDKLRNHRKPLLEALDIEYTRAAERKESTEDIVNKKQYLRDITKIVDKCETVKDLKAVSLVEENSPTDIDENGVIVKEIINPVLIAVEDL